MNVNLVCIAGNLCRDPEQKNVGTTNVCKFTIASNRKFKDKEEVTFVDCVAWGKTAETITKFFTKGKPIYIQGRLTYESWAAKDGTKKSRLVVTVDNFQFVGDNKGGKKPEPDSGPPPDPNDGPPPTGDSIPF